MQRGLRRGFTVLETLLAVALGVVVLGGALGLLVSVTRASKAGEVAGALQDAALALAGIERDALRAVAGPDGKPAVRIEASALKLALGTFAPDGKITATLLRYEPVPQGGGGFRLRRTEGGSASLVPALLERYRFEQLAGPGGPYLRATLYVSGNAVPTPGAAAGDPAVLSVLVRLAGIELAGSRLSSLEFLDGVKSVLGP